MSRKILKPKVRQKNYIRNSMSIIIPVAVIVILLQLSYLFLMSITNSMGFEKDEVAMVYFYEIPEEIKDSEESFSGMPALYMDDVIYEEVSKLEEVKKSSPNYALTYEYILTNTQTSYRIYPVNFTQVYEDFFDMVDLEYEGKYPKEENQVIVGYGIANRYDLEIGDLLRVARENKREEDYEIVGILEEKPESVMNFMNGIINNSFYTSVSSPDTFYTIYVETDDLDTFKENFENIVMKNNTIKEKYDNGEIGITYFNNDFINDMMEIMLNYFNYFIISMAIISCILIFSVQKRIFTLIINKTQREIAIFKMLKSNNKDIVQYFAYPIYKVMLVGTIIGIIIGSIVCILLAIYLNWKYYINITSIIIPICMYAFVWLLTRISINKKINNLDLLEIVRSS